MEETYIFCSNYDCAAIYPKGAGDRVTKCPVCGSSLWKEERAAYLRDAHQNYNEDMDITEDQCVGRFFFWRNQIKAYHMYLSTFIEISAYQDEKKPKPTPGPFQDDEIPFA